LVGAAAGVAALLAGLDSVGSLGSLAAAAMAAAVAAGIADLLLASLIHVLRRIGSMADLVRNAAPPLLLSIPLYTPLVTGLAFIYQRSSPFVLLLFFIPALAAQRLFVLFQNERRLNREVTSHVDQLESAHSSFVDALVVTLDARDRYTAGHSHAVAVYARDIAHALGLPAEEQALAYRCGLVHDIGKIGVAPGLLEKPGALTLNERREVERHPVVGEEILARIDGNQQLAAIVRHHHERLDGQGYPDGLRGEQIPLLSRVLAVADTYNAMTSERPYREAMPSRVARLRLQQAAGSQLDVEALVAFERLLATRGEDYRTAQGREFVRENTPKPVEFNPADELPYQLLAAAG
jgi:putative nucleotidyltransferase with HDIG domain